MSKNSSSRTAQLRQRLAQETARIMIEQGINDFLLAKRKAATRWAVHDSACLPNNTEITAALAERQRLFAADAHRLTLQSLRQTALQVMRWLTPLQPHIVGPVLTGTVSQHTEITLHLFSDPPESVSLLLLERDIQYTLREKNFRYDPHRTLIHPCFYFVASTYTIEAIVFPLIGLRQAPLCPVSSKPMYRAKLKELAQLTCR